MLRNLLILTLGLLILFISDPALAKKKNPKHLKDLKCAVNEIARFNGIKWKCSLDEDTGDTLGDLSCDTSQIAEYDGNEWVCADKGDSGVPAGPKFILKDNDSPPKQMGEIVTIQLFSGAFSAGAFSGRQVLTRIPFQDSNGNQRFIGLVVESKEIIYQELVPGVGLWFETSDCTLQGYIEYSPGRQFPTAFQAFSVVGELNQPDVRVLYIAISEVIQEITAVSLLGPNSNGCFTPTIPDQKQVIPVELIDSDLHTTFPPPFTLEFQ